MVSEYTVQCANSYDLLCNSNKLCKHSSQYHSSTIDRKEQKQTAIIDKRLSDEWDEGLSGENCE